MEQGQVTILQVFIGIISGLLSLNLWFIRRLTIKIDESWSAMRDFRKDIEHLNQKIDALSDLSKRVFLLENTIAVLQFVTSKADKGDALKEVFDQLEK